MRNRRRLFSSESVTNGHPDKAADQVSDAVLDACLREDPDARVGCETVLKGLPTKRSFCILTGEITTRAKIDPTEIASRVLTNIGYRDGDTEFDPKKCHYINLIGRQSPDISIGVTAGEGLYAEQGAGDQGMMFGFACNETPVFIPASLYWARRLTDRLTEVRERRSLPYLRPDGKAQVTVEYVGDRLVRIATVVVSAHHLSGIPHERLMDDIQRLVIDHTLPRELCDDQTRSLINPTGQFVIGGPRGDAGLTGRKIIVDTYGGHGSHGGGAFSGKDPSKVDRSGAYMARYVAKNIVAAGLAARAQIQLAYAIGVAEPVSVYVDTFNTAREGVDEERLEQIVREFFPLTPAGIIAHFELKRPIYRSTASNGHFGNPAFPWEQLDMVDQLRSAMK